MSLEIFGMTALVDAVAKKNNLSKQEVETTLKSAIEVMTDALHQEKVVRLLGFGTLKPKKRAAMVKRNPKTGEPVQVPASRGVLFTLAKSFKDHLNGTSAAPVQPAKKTTAPAKKK